MRSTKVSAGDIPDWVVSFVSTFLNTGAPTVVEYERWMFDHADCAVVARNQAEKFAPSETTEYRNAFDFEREQCRGKR